jgi:hypothetical protein
MQAGRFEEMDKKLHILVAGSSWALGSLCSSF